MFAMNDFHIVNAIDVHKGREDRSRDIFIDGDGHHIRALVCGSADLHAVDIDACTAKNGSDLTDHARLVFMRSDDDAALRFEVYAEMVEGDDLGILAVKEGACDAVCPLVGVDGEGMVFV